MFKPQEALHFIPPGTLINICLPTSGAVPPIFQLAATPKREIPVLLQAAVAKGIV